MYFRQEDLAYVEMCCAMNCEPAPKLVFATDRFVSYLLDTYKNVFNYKTSDAENSIYVHWTGIPVIIDNTMRPQYYRLVY